MNFYDGCSIHFVDTVSHLPSPFSPPLDSQQTLIWFLTTTLDATKEIIRALEPSSSHLHIWYPSWSFYILLGNLGNEAFEDITYFAILSASVWGMWILGMLDIGVWCKTADGGVAINPYSLLRAWRAAAALASFLLLPVKINGLINMNFYN